MKRRTTTLRVKMRTMKARLEIVLLEVTRCPVRIEGEAVRSSVLQTSTFTLSTPAAEVEPAPVGERVGVALALLAAVLAVFVPRAIATLAALGHERAPARNRVILLQVAAVPTDLVAHVAHLLTE
jgi:hypothetical protein